jgi:hypothetical protein
LKLKERENEQKKQLTLKIHKKVSYREIEMLKVAAATAPTEGSTTGEGTTPTTTTEEETTPGTEEEAEAIRQALLKQTELERQQLERARYRPRC